MRPLVVLDGITAGKLGKPTTWLCSIHLMLVVDTEIIYEKAYLLLPDNMKRLKVPPFTMSKPVPESRIRNEGITRADAAAWLDKVLNRAAEKYGPPLLATPPEWAAGWPLLQEEPFQMPEPDLYVAAQAYILDREAAKAERDVREEAKPPQGPPDLKDEVARLQFEINAIMGISAPEGWVWKGNRWEDQDTGTMCVWRPSGANTIHQVRITKLEQGERGQRPTWANVSSMAEGFEALTGTSVVMRLQKDHHRGKVVHVDGQDAHWLGHARVGLDGKKGSVYRAADGCLVALTQKEEEKCG